MISCHNMISRYDIIIAYHNMILKYGIGRADGLRTGVRAGPRRRAGGQSDRRMGGRTSGQADGRTDSAVNVYVYIRLQWQFPFTEPLASRHICPCATTVESVP